MVFLEEKSRFRAVHFICMIALILTAGCGKKQSEWKPGEIPLKTKWSEEISPSEVLSEYPRPQMVRGEWLNVNGLWEFAAASRDAGKPVRLDRKILVPFPVESSLSGICERITENQRLWYRKSVKFPEGWRGQKILLHFGAADWETEVWVNGERAGLHRGGYDDFTFDITSFLIEGDSQEILAAVWDPTDRGGQPAGKQRTEPGGIFYTPSSGIWRTVWMEPVPEAYIRSIRLTAKPKQGKLLLDAETAGLSTGSMLNAEVFAGNHHVASAKGPAGKTIEISIPDPRVWSPGDPFLYDLELTLAGEEAASTDRLRSYFGMRSVSVGKDEKGVTRLFLNGDPVFMLGPLDQGFWPDGLYTAPSDEALRYDLEIMKEMGFNMVRKHVKVEPSRWYYWCDKLGLLVWQDMPSGKNETEEDKKQFEKELERIIRKLINHPSIVMWVPFNEGWGQYESERIVEIIREIDPGRLVDHASGWHDKGIGDVVDIHSYPEPKSPRKEEHRAAVLGEFGGLGLNVSGHTWREGWGYDLLTDRESLVLRYEQLFSRLLPLVEEPGLSAAVYTQITDIETENNGLLTYDRKITKMVPEYIRLAHRGYFPPRLKGRSRIFIDSMSVELECFRAGAEIRYTIDGSEPVKNSLLYAKPLKLEKSTIVKAGAFWDNGVESRVITYRIERVSPLRSRKGKDLIPGLCMSVFHGDWRELPGFDGLTPDSQKVVEDLELNPGMERHYALQWRGVLQVPKTGVYVFYTVSDDGSRLFIDGRQVVDNNGVHGKRERFGAVALEKGFHPLVVQYFQRTGGRMLQVIFEGPGLERQKIPSSRLFHDVKETDF